MIRRPPRSTLSSSSAASDVYKRQVVKLLKNGLCRRAGVLGSAQGHGVAVDHGLDAEAVLKHGKICVIVAEEVAHEPDIVEIDDGGLSAPVGWRYPRALRRCSTPARQRCLPNAGLARHRAA